MDWVGKWYALQEERGEFARIRFGLLEEGREPVWFAVPHQEADGIGAFAGLLRTLGYGAFDALPQIRHADRSTGQRRRIARPAVQVAVWRDIDVDWTGGLPEAACPRAVCWSSLSADQTQHLQQVARDSGASLNSLALWALNHAVAPWLADGMGAPLWSMPVNLRGAVAAASDIANQFAIIDIELDHEKTAVPQQVHAVVGQLLAQGAHWQAWDAWSIGERVGEEGMRMLYEKSLRSGRTKTGIYSNLGTWDDGNTAPAADWVFLAPVTKEVPFAACLLTWRGRLTAAVQAHPALSTDPQQARVWLQAWLDALCASGPVLHKNK